MKIEIDQGSGFCFGVTRAINKAEEELARGATLYCLGDIVHNGKECDRLKKLGLITIDHATFSTLHHAKVLLRAHGEPPATYGQAETNGIEIIDATCPVVLHLQERIKKEYQEGGTESKQIVIYGKNGHAEVLGLVGQTDGKAIVIESPEEVDKLDFNRDICLYSQTTKPLEGFRKIVEYIGAHISPTATFRYYDTICRQVANRMPHIRDFATRHDVILFVCGKKSSNGKVLYDECRSVNPRSYLVDAASEIDFAWLEDCRSVGICGATSTPKWLMEERRSHPEADATVNTQDGASCPEENQPGRMCDIRPGWFLRATSAHRSEAKYSSSNCLAATKEVCRPDNTMASASARRDTICSFWKKLLRNCSLMVSYIQYLDCSLRRCSKYPFPFTKSI